MSRPRRGSTSSLTNIIAHLFEVLNRNHDTGVILAPISYPSVASGAAATLLFNRNVKSWREAALFSPQVVSSQSRQATRLLAALSPQPEVGLQIGGMFSSVGGGASRVPLCLWIDRSFHPDVVHTVPWGPRPYREWFFRFQHDLYARCNYIFTMSDWARTQVMEWHGVPAERVVTVGGGINTGLPPHPPPMQAHPPTLLFVGNLYWTKGVDVLLRAWPIVSHQLPNARLHLVGEPRDMRLPAVLPNGVRFHGPIRERPILDALFQESTALVLPSRSDTLGHVALESFAFARPVIATTVGAIPEWVQDGVTGFTVPVGDAEALAARCIEVLSDPRAAQRMGRAGYERVRKEGTWEAVVAKMEPYLLQAAEEGSL